MSEANAVVSLSTSPAYACQSCGAHVVGVRLTGARWAFFGTSTVVVDAMPRQGYPRTYEAHRCGQR